MNDHRFNDIPLILETPEYKGESIYDEEIKLLYSLVENKNKDKLLDLEDSELLNKIKKNDVKNK